MTPDDSLDSRSARPQTCFVDVPDVAYARSGEVAIAYQVFGEGPVDLVFSDPVSELGARVSLKAGLVLGVSITLLTLLALAPRRRPVVVPTPVP